MADVNLSLDLTLNVQEQTTHRIKKFGFGDGYVQIAADGINTRLTEYQITTKPLPVADAATLKSNLDSVIQGDYFLATLTPFSTQQRRYRIKGNAYSRQYLPSNTTAYEVFQFTLEEAYS